MLKWQGSISQTEDREVLAINRGKQEPGACHNVQVMPTGFSRSFYIQYMTLCLGLFSLGNLVAYAGFSGVLNFADMIYLMTFAVILARIVKDPATFHKEMGQPESIATYATGLLASYFFSYRLYGGEALIGILVWFLTFVLNLLLMRQFVNVQIHHKRGLWKMTPIWYLIFVSICAAALNGYKMGIPLLPYMILAFALVAYVILTPIILIRLRRGDPFSQVMEPTKALMCATPSLCYLTLMTLFDQVPMLISVIFLLISQGFLIWLYQIIWKCFKCQWFLPSYASFTFALATSCLDLSLFRDAYISLASFSYGALTVLASLEMLVAVLIIAFVLMGFVMYTVRVLCLGLDIN